MEFLKRMFSFLQFFRAIWNFVFGASILSCFLLGNGDLPAPIPSTAGKDLLPFFDTGQLLLADAERFAAINAAVKGVAALDEGEVPWNKNFHAVISLSSASSVISSNCSGWAR